MAKKFQGSLAILVILILLCWPAAIIYYFMKRDESEDQGQMRVCQGCGANVPLSYNICPHCGRQFVMQPYGAAPPQQPYYAPPPTAGSGGSFCKQCGTALRPGEVFCSKCGGKV